MAASTSPARRGKVTFDSTVRFETKSSGKSRYRPAMAAEITTEVFQEFESKDITDAMLAEAAQLFSEHYGTWDTPDGGRGGKRGNFSGRLPLHCTPSPAIANAAKRM
jgi:hypothetical protein